MDRSKSTGKFRPGSSAVQRLRGIICSLVLVGTPALADPFDHEWCSFSTSHFDVITDVPNKQVQKIIRRMGLFRLSVNQYIGADTAGSIPTASGAKSDEVAPSKPPLKVLIFRSRRDFRTTVKSGLFAGFMQPSLIDSRLVFGPQNGNRFLGETALHEYTHFLVRDRVDMSYPIWYEEGLASFLSTMTFVDGKALIGATPSETGIRITLNKTRLRLAEVLDAHQISTWRHEKLSAFYAWSWLFVHYLNFGPDAHEHQAQLRTFLNDPNRDFETAFETSPNSLEKALKRYLKYRGRVRLEPLPEKVTDESNSFSPVEPRCLTDQERNFELAVTMSDHNPAGAITILNNLLDEQYTPIRTLVALSGAYAHNQEAERSLQSAEDAYGRDNTNISARIQLANVLIGDCVFRQDATCNDKWQKAIPLLRSATRSNPERYDAIYDLGLAYLYSGQAGDAINYLRVAYTKVPWSPRINYYLGEAYRLVGDRRARTHLTNAHNWSYSDAWRNVAEFSLEKLD